MPDDQTFFPVVETERLLRRALENSDAEVFRAELGIGESGTDRIIKRSFQLLGLISFFSIASDEIRA